MNARLPMRTESWELGNLICRPNFPFRFTGTNEGNFPSKSIGPMKAAVPEETYTRFCASETGPMKKRNILAVQCQWPLKKI